MLNILNRLINSLDINELQFAQYSEKLLMSDSCDRNSTQLSKVSVSSLGAFLCLFVTGSYETLYGSDPVADVGVDFLRGKLKDGSNGRDLFNDYVPFHLWLSPGRVKTISSPGYATDPLGFPLFYPIELVYQFKVNSDIQLEVKNLSDVAINYNILFHGVRFPEGQYDRVKKIFDKKKNKTF